MPKIEYVAKSFRDRALEMVDRANGIIGEYSAQGYRLTLRQLYYQFVARGLLANKQREYKRLGNVVNDARLAGLIDWLAIEDRTRHLASLAHWSDPSEIVDGAAAQYREDRWETQPYRPEVWIEKEALAGVFEGVCRRLDVPYLSCRGYTSQSEMWGAAMRLHGYVDQGQTPVIFHFGDHDPSGLDMTRDIVDRLHTFGLDVHLRRLALNMDQVEEWNPPPNPAKTTDSRFAGYVAEYGHESWELDALEPATLTELATDAIMGLVDYEAWYQVRDSIREGRELLTKVSERWNDVARYLEGSDDA